MTGGAGGSEFQTSPSVLLLTCSPRFWYSGYHYAWASGGGTGESDAFVFKSNLPEAGCWWVDTWYNADASRSSSVPCVGCNASGYHTNIYRANQQVNGGRWAQVGEFCFTAGMNQIRISRDAPGDGFINADAIRLRK